MFATKNVFGYSVGPSIINPGGGATRIMIPGKRHAVDRAQVHHCHVQHQEHLLTATEVKRLSDEAEAQFLKDNGTLQVKTPAADAMGRDNSALVTNDLMELQLPPLGGPKLAILLVMRMFLKEVRKLWSSLKWRKHMMGMRNLRMRPQ